MPPEPIIVLRADAHFATRLRRRGHSFWPWFGRLKASGDGLRVRSQYFSTVSTADRFREDAMAPIDYFMGIFVGMCFGLAGLAYVAVL
jgi:hypothetical protein